MIRNWIVFLLGVLMILLIIMGCGSSSDPRIPLECVGWKPDKILNTDDKAEQMRKLSYNTAMQSRCPKGGSSWVKGV